MKAFALLLALMTVSAFAVPAAKKPAPTDPLYQQSYDLNRGTKIDKQSTAQKKKFKAKHTLQEDVKEAELLEQKDESSPE